MPSLEKEVVAYVRDAGQPTDQDQLVRSFSDQGSEEAVLGAVGNALDDDDLAYDRDWDLVLDER
jgi:hypothetical protein